MSAQVRNPDRVNISIDGKYRFSLTIGQVVDLGVKVGLELDEAALADMEVASSFGKLYQRTLEYSLVRPRSEREVRDYLYKKTRPAPVRSRRTGEVSMRPGVEVSVADEVVKTLLEKGHIDDRRFAEFWVEHRFVKKGVSARKLRAELASKGVASSVVEEVMAATERSDESELAKIIAKKRHRYPDDTKFMQYLARQGFGFDDIKAALEELADHEA